MQVAALSGRIYTNIIFEGLSRDQVAGILPCMAVAVKSYRPRECVLDRGEPVQGPGIVLDGELVRGGDAAAERIGSNQLFGEAPAFSGRAAEERLIAGRSARVLYLSESFFLSLCGKDCVNRESHRVVARNMLRVLSDRALALDRKIAYLTAGDLKRKIAMYLWELYEQGGGALSLEMPLNRNRLADFFSVARPSLSRELTNLRALGVIDFYRSRVTVLDAAALERMARGEG